MQPSSLTNEKFREWRLNRGFSHSICAKRLGISISSVFSYENGMRKEGLVKIPLVVALAMSAIMNNLKPYGDRDDNNNPS